MPKLLVLNSKELIKILEKFGFQVDHATGSHFVFYHSATERRTVVPRHNKDLPKGTLMNIIKEAGISKEEIEMVAKNKK